MKAILLSIKPQWIAKILNGEKTIEVRKKFPKDYVGWVYVYCSKSKPYLYGDKSVYEGKQECFWIQKIEGNGIVPLLNGKVVARFWCDKVEEIEQAYTQGETMFDWFEGLRTETINMFELLKLSCLSEKELEDYLDYSTKKEYYGYAIHISKLEIFDRPRELKYFHYRKLFHRNEPDEEGRKTFKALIQLNKAPQNYCYVEGE